MPGSGLALEAPSAALSGSRSGRAGRGQGCQPDAPSPRLLLRQSFGVSHVRFQWSQVRPDINSKF